MRGGEDDARARVSQGLSPAKRHRHDRGGRSYASVQLDDEVVLGLSRADGDVYHSIDAELPYIFNALRTQVSSQLSPAAHHTQRDQHHK